MARQVTSRLCPHSSANCYKLAFLSPTNQAYLLRYMDARAARQYARGTVEAIVTVLMRLLRHLPPTRSTALATELTLTTTQDITDFVRLAQAAGLAPSTINLSLSLLAEFFDFLREEGLMLSQPVSKRRHRLLAPTTLPKPIAEADLVR